MLNGIKHKAVGIFEPVVGLPDEIDDIDYPRPGGLVVGITRGKRLHRAGAGCGRTESYDSG